MIFKRIEVSQREARHRSEGPKNRPVVLGREPGNIADLSDSRFWTAQWLEDAAQHHCGGCRLEQTPHARLSRLEEEKRKVQEAEWERQRIEREERDEQKRFENLELCVSGWRRAQGIRDFIQALERACVENGEPTGPDTERGKWIQWAHGKADSLEPRRRL